MRAATNTLTTYGFHAILTHKQADCLSYLWADGEDERPCTTSEIAECFYELNWYDLQEGNRVHYAPPSTGSMYATLKGLERRGLVSQDDVRDHRGSWKSYVWTLTPAGREAARLYCR